MLIKFRHDSRIAMVSGNNFHSTSVEESYYFTKYVHIWGWATWKRSWALYDINLTDWPVARKFLLNDIFKKSITRVLWHRNFKKCFYNKIDTWDYQLLHSSYHFGKLHVIPNHNLTKNVGFNDQATHTKFSPVPSPMPKELVDAHFDKTIGCLLKFEKQNRIFLQQQLLKSLRTYLNLRIKSLLKSMTKPFNMLLK